MSEPFQPFPREQGIFVTLDADNGELRLHRDEAGRFHAHRWRFDRFDMQNEPSWRGAVAFGLTATEIHDAHWALSRAAEPATKGAKK
jgi:hypothetical protein